MVKGRAYSTMDIDNLDLYYEDCVIGGPGSFVVSIKDRDKFKEAIRTKLLLEVAGRTLEPRIVPVRRNSAGALPRSVRKYGRTAGGVDPRGRRAIKPFGNPKRMTRPGAQTGRSCTTRGWMRPPVSDADRDPSVDHQ